jgi:hypothetical protein
MTAIREICGIADRMLSEIEIIKPADKTIVNDRLLNGVMERVYRATSTYALSAAGTFAYLGGLLSIPVILLIFSTPEHSLGVDALLYMASIPLTLFGVVIAAVIFLIGFEDLLSSKREIFWAWTENEETESLQKRTARRRRSVYRLVPVAVLVLAAALASAYFLRSSRATYIELACIVVLTIALTAVITFVAEVSARTSKPRVARLADSLYPGDAMIIDLINLAFFIMRNRVYWQNGVTIRRIISECERSARMTQYTFPGLCGRALVGDAETMTWARDQSAQLAAGMRRHKRALLVVSGPGTLDVLLESFCSNLISLCKGNWLELSRVPEATSRTGRFKRWVRLAIGPVLLTVAAIAIPLFIHTPELRSTIRLYLILTAVLSVVTVISPETLKAAEVIQGVIEKISNKSRQ